MPRASCPASACVVEVPVPRNALDRVAGDVRGTRPVRRASPRSRRPTACFAASERTTKSRARARARRPRPRRAGRRRSRRRRQPSSPSDLGLDAQPGSAVESKRDRTPARDVACVVVRRSVALDREAGHGSEATVCGDGRPLLARRGRRVAARGLHRRGRRAAGDLDRDCRDDDDGAGRDSRARRRHPSPGPRDHRDRAAHRRPRRAPTQGYDRVVFEFRNGAPGLRGRLRQNGRSSRTAPARRSPSRAAPCSSCGWSRLSTPI